MREIKFRGNRLDNGQWIYGSFFKTEVGCFVGEYNVEVQVIPETVGQFIGLKDKNGNEIYEGDIITHQRKSQPYSEKAKTVFVKCLVKWDSGVSEAGNKSNASTFNQQPRFVAFPINRECKGANWGYNWSEFHDCEVIGNIHDAPHLLNPPQGDAASLINMNNNYIDPKEGQEQEQAAETQAAETQATEEKAAEAVEGE